MNLLITGASGFLGSHLVEAAISMGHHVRALARKTSRVDVLERLGAEITRGDLKDSASLQQAVEGIDGIINAASSMDGIPQETDAATIKGTRELLHVAEQAGVRRFVHISSIGIYSARNLAAAEVIDEEFPLEQSPRFMSDYVRSKIASESAALEFSKRGKMKILVLRAGILYGPRGAWTLPRTGYPLGRNAYAIVGMGKNSLPVCYVGNCADAALVALGKEDVFSGIFNIVDDERITQAEFFRALKTEALPGLRIVRAPYALWNVFTVAGELVGRLLKIPFPFRSSQVFMCGWRARYSNERAKTILGWRPRVGKTEALSCTMKYYAGRYGATHRADLGKLQQVQVLDSPMSMCMIGCGVIADEHLSILKRMNGVRVAAICDTNSEAASKTASKFGLSRTYDDVRRMLSAEKPQIVHIVTPPQSHAALSQLAIESGCDVLVEKPMALTAKQAVAMAEIAARHGKRLCVDHNHMYDPVMIRARRLIESGDLGDIVWVESYYGFNLGDNPANRYMLPGAEKHWTFQLPGGLYQNLASHPLSLALDVLGKPNKVYAHARYGRVLPHASTDELRIVMETSRASGMVVVSLAASPRAQFLNIYGTKMTIYVDILNKWIITQGSIRGLPKPISRALMHIGHGTTVLGGTLSGVAKVLRGTWNTADGMEILIRDFYASIREGRPAPVTAQEGVWTMEIMDQVWQQIGMTSSQEEVNHNFTRSLSQA